MFNPTEIVIDAFVDSLQAHYRRTYGRLEPDYPEIIAFVGRMALETIANSDAPYHDVHHTMMVTEVGQQILRGKHLSKGGVKPRDWLDFTVGQLADINYIRKAGALFAEFQETGIAEKLGYHSPAHIRAGYPAFFWKVVSPYIQEALQFLRATQEGKQWVANLYSHVFTEEHQVPAIGPER